MNVPPKFAVLNVGVNPVAFQQTLDVLFDWISCREKKYLSLCNAYTVTEAYDAPQVGQVINGSDLAVADGMPLVWLAHALGHARAERIYGPDLMLALCDQGQPRGVRHYFYGATPDVLVQLSERLLARFPALEIAGSYAPPFRALTEQEELEIAEKINAAQPDVIWVSLGTPKQDLWIGRNRPRLNAALMVPVGAAFDFHSGRKPQAPTWMRRSGLEWVFRLLSEPRRLWRRYLIHTPRFAGLVFLQKLGLKKFNAPSPRPAQHANICGVNVDSIRLNELLERIRDAIQKNTWLSVYNANAHMINLAQDDGELRRALDEASIVFCDGQGLRLAAHFLGNPVPERFTPPDWVDQLEEICRDENAPMFLLGAQQGVAEEAAQRMKERCPGLQVFTSQGYFEHYGEEGLRVIEKINASGAKVLLVGMGMPLQEKWLRWAAPHLKVNVVMCVGALFDYIAGRVPRGPRWLTSNGFEWLWRLIVEPRRLWRRYLIGNPRFLLNVLRQKFGRS